MINVRAFLQLLKERFNSNQSAMAKAFGIKREHLNLVLKKNGSGAGAVFCGAIIKYCDRNGLDFRDYIFLL